MNNSCKIVIDLSTVRNNSKKITQTVLEHLFLSLVIWSIFKILQLTIQKKDTTYNVHVSG